MPHETALRSGMGAPSLTCTARAAVFAACSPALSAASTAHTSAHTSGNTRTDAGSALRRYPLFQSIHEPAWVVRRVSASADAYTGRPVTAIQQSGCNRMRAHSLFYALAKCCMVARARTQPRPPAWRYVATESRFGQRLPHAVASDYAAVRAHAHGTHRHGALAYGSCIRRLKTGVGWEGTGTGNQDQPLSLPNDQHFSSFSPLPVPVPVQFTLNQ